MLGELRVFGITVGMSQCVCVSGQSSLPIHITHLSLITLNIHASCTDSCAVVFDRHSQLWWFMWSEYVWLLRSADGGQLHRRWHVHAQPAQFRYHNGVLFARPERAWRRMGNTLFYYYLFLNVILLIILYYRIFSNYLSSTSTLFTAHPISLYPCHAVCSDVGHARLVDPWCIHQFQRSVKPLDHCHLVQRGDPKQGQPHQQIRGQTHII